MKDPTGTYCTGCSSSFRAAAPTTAVVESNPEGIAIHPDDSAAIRQTYNPRKPKWWKHLAGRATKSQKRAIRNVLDDRGLRLPDIPFGSVLDWDKVFASPSLDGVTTDTTKVNNDMEYNHQQGRTPSENQQDDAKREIWLELGFGRGENLLALARQYRNRKNVFFVGAEVHNPGIGVVCQRIQHAWDGSKVPRCNKDDDGAKSQTRHCCVHANTDGYWNEYKFYSSALDPFRADSQDTTNNQNQSETVPNFDDSPTVADETRPPYSNLRIHAGDGFKLLLKIPSGSLSAILVTFPDPFPKDEEKQWRLIQLQTLMEFHRILRKGDTAVSHVTEDDKSGKRVLPSGLSNVGRFFLATDHPGYCKWVHETMDSLNSRSTKVYFRFVHPVPDRNSWLPAVSTYEHKGWQEGRRTHLVCWEAC
ncbi:putative methyltransferase [Nitzschia inconspicua]|uniref:Methyltransferase n=1 Tax=Nitzschia inconspicua TaxID=303405 RepID=A0A9K3PYP9_9STRA|nr:putative methyltransferase [Nitzschia inconspicua]